MHVSVQWPLYNISVFSPRIIQGTMGGHGWGGVCGHIKAFWALSFPTSKKNLYWRLAGLSRLKYTGGNTVIKLIHYFKYSKKSSWMMKFPASDLLSYRRPAKVHPYTTPHSLHTVQAASFACKHPSLFNLAYFLDNEISSQWSQECYNIHCLLYDNAMLHVYDLI